MKDKSSDKTLIYQHPYLVVVGEEHTGSGIDHLELERLAQIGLERCEKSTT